MGFLLGFLPWIVYWALVGNVDFRFAVCIALAVVIGTQLVSLCRQIRLLHQGFLSGMPVIPSAIIGTDIIAPPGKIITKIVSPTVKFGERLDFRIYAPAAKEAAARQAKAGEADEVSPQA